MLFATASFVACDSFMKLVTEALPPFEVLFLRGIAATICCGTLVLALGHWLRLVGSCFKSKAHSCALLRDGERPLLCGRARQHAHRRCHRHHNKPHRWF